MSTLYSLLSLGAFVAFIICLKNPRIIFKSGTVSRKKSATIFLVMFIVFFGLYGSTLPKENIDTAVQSNVNTITETVTITMSPTPEPKPLSMEETINEAVKKGLNKNVKFTSTYDATTKLATVTLEQSSEWDESSTVKNTFSSLVKIGVEVFKTPEISSLSVIKMGSFTDQYGKKSTEKAVQFTMDKSEFEKFDWKNLSYTNVYNQMMDNTSVHYIHPALLKNLDPDKIYLAY